VLLPYFTPTLFAESNGLGTLMLENALIACVD